MANTYTLISSNVLTGTAASVTFSSIPATYTDLVLRATCRGTAGGTGYEMAITFNSDTGTNYSFTKLSVNQNTVISERLSNGTSLEQIVQDSGGNTANTFNSWEIYIPSYTVSQNKPFSIDNFVENNNATSGAWIQPFASLWRNTATINTLNISAQFTTFVAGSSFYLYGIKNS